MADIFISYSRRDRARIEQLAGALEAQNHTVWWDRKIIGGAEFATEIQKEIDAASVVIVVWSAHANTSPWVRDEAARAQKQGKLIPVTIDDVDIPMGFGQYETIHLRNWRNDATALAFQDLCRTITAVISGETLPSPLAPAKIPWMQRLIQPLPLVLVSAFVVMVVIGAFLAPRTASFDAADTTAGSGGLALNETATIAVLPFDDMSEGGDQEYFADGIAEEILNVLTRMPDLKVSGRMSSFTFRDVSDNLASVGKQLGVSHVLTGSVRKMGPDVRVNVRLINAADGFHLWSETYERELTDIFVIQDEISHAVADALSVRMNAELLNVAGTENIVAYDLYLQARQLLARRNGDSISQAAELFSAATLLDNNYDAAYAGRATAQSVLTIHTDVNNLNALLADALGAAEKALALNPSNVEAHSMRAFLKRFHQWEWDAAQQDVEHAIALAPNNADIANFAGDHFRNMLDLERAMEWESKAISLDPLHAVNYMDLGWIFLPLTRCDATLELAKQALDIDPSLTLGWYGRSRAELCLDKLADASRSVARLEEIAPGSIYSLDRSVDLARALGEPEKMHNLLDLLERKAADGMPVHFILADHYALIGAYETAGAWLLEAYERRDPYFLFDDTRLLPEHWPDHPAIQAVLAKPELHALYEIRRRNLAAYEETQTDD